MFGKKKAIGLEVQHQGGYYRLVIDYFDAKDKKQVRNTLFTYLFQKYGPLLLQVDSNFLNKEIDGKEEPWMMDLIKWASQEELEHEYFKFKRQVSKGFLGGIFGGKAEAAGYRVGLVVDENQLPEILKRHDEIQMGIRLGGQIVSANHKDLLKDYCAGLIEDINFEKYYGIDFYDYSIVSRAVLKGLDKDEIETAKTELEDLLL